MKRTLIDTDPLIALFDRNDKHRSDKFVFDINKK